MIAPPEDDEELTPAQVIQIFFNCLLLELVLICVFFTPPEGSTESDSVGGGRRHRNSGEASEEDTPVDFSFQSISIISTVLSGLIASGVTFAVVYTMESTFKWGNSRMRKRRKGLEELQTALLNGWSSITGRLGRPIHRKRGTAAVTPEVPIVDAPIVDGDADAVLPGVHGGAHTADSVAQQEVAEGRCSSEPSELSATPFAGAFSERVVPDSP
eukprot:986755-Prymnesium_polylepis.1